MAYIILYMFVTFAIEMQNPPQIKAFKCKVCNDEHEDRIEERHYDEQAQEQRADDLEEGWEGRAVPPQRAHIACELARQHPYAAQPRRRSELQSHPWF